MTIIGPLCSAILIIYFITEFSTVCQSEKEDYTFKVNHDRNEVEELVIKYLNQKDRPTPPVTRLIRIIMRKNAKKVDVCKLQNHTKAQICHEILRFTYFGFKVLDNAENLKCQNYPISVRTRSPNILQNNVLFMYKCPRLSFLDLETDELVILPIENYVSNTQQKASFFLHRQEGNRASIYPEKYAYDVHFDKIVPAHRLVSTEESHPVSSVSRVQSDLDRTFRQWVDTRKLQKPYEKFGRTYNLFSICGMRRSYKISICRDVAKKRAQDFFVHPRGYDEAACRRRPVPPSMQSLLEDEPLVPTVKCPTLSQEVFKLKKYRPELLFISGTAESRKVLVYHKMNFNGEQLNFHMVVEYDNFHHFEMDRRRQREIMMPEYIRDPVTQIQQTIAMTAVLMEVPSIVITLDRGLIEDHTIAYSKTLNPDTLESTISDSIRIGDLEQDDLKRLCSQILESAYFNNLNINYGDINFEYGTYFDPIHIEIKLVLRDAEMLPQEKLIVRQCPPVHQSNAIYSLSGGTEKGSVLVYVKYLESLYWIPEAFVRNVDIEYLRYKKVNMPTRPGVGPIESSASSSQTPERAPTTRWVPDSETITEIEIEEEIPSTYTTAYEKFRRAYDTPSICEMRRSHKISMCRDAVKDSPYKFHLYFRGYDEDAYRR